MAETERQRTGRDELSRRAEHLEQLRESVESQTLGEDQSDETGELNAVDNHPADLSDFTFQRELDSTIGQILSDEEQQVRRAMDAKAQGRYGICEDCGQPIGKARLKARPEATRCIDCQRRREGENPADHGAGLPSLERAT